MITLILGIVGMVGVTGNIQTGRYTKIEETVGLYSGNVEYKITRSPLDCGEKCRIDDCDGYAVSKMSERKYSCVYDMNPAFLPNSMTWQVYGGKEFNLILCNIMYNFCLVC